MTRDNEISHKFHEGSDLAEREQEVLKDASERSGFVPTEIIGRSAWWGSTEIGAFHCLGEYKGKKAVLKVQGVKPATSEIHMIKSFSKTNRSDILRPPYLYFTLPWNDERRYEALIMEFIEGNKVIHAPTNEQELGEFFGLFINYRTNCLKSPWLRRPQESISEKVTRNFVKWREASFKIYSNHPHRKEEDKELIDEAVKVLVKEYQGVEPEFQHAHLGDGDLYKVGNQVVVLSNLYWSWRPPLYDAVFGYHWFMYHLADVEGITPQQVEEQRSLWLHHVENLPEVRKDNRRLLKLALLERAAAGLNLDALSLDPKRPITEYLVNATRDQVKSLIKHLK